MQLTDLVICGYCGDIQVFAGVKFAPRRLKGQVSQNIKLNNMLHKIPFDDSETGIKKQ